MAYWRLYYHITWATKGRSPILTLAIEANVHRLIGIEATREGGHVYALNSMPDHVHLVVAIPPTSQISSFMKQVKGASSYFMGEQYQLPLYWQEGYGIFSLGPQGLEAAVNYVRNQKQHHADGTIIEALEKFSPNNEGPTLPILLFES